MSLLESFPELPLLLVVLVAILVLRALRRAIFAVLLAVIVLFIVSSVLHWPPPALADLPTWWPPAGTLGE